MMEKSDILKILEKVCDPEIPVLTIQDMGIVRDIRMTPEHVEVVITPTYTGCPAMKMIEMQIIAELNEHGIQNSKVSTILSPAWTTDWMSEEGKRKLKEYGIAPPVGKACDSISVSDEHLISCPRCDSNSTKLISQFGSTPCKAMYQCKECLEPFDYFKCH